MRFRVITVRRYDAYLNTTTASHTAFLAVSWGLLLQNPRFFSSPSQKNTTVNGWARSSQFGNTTAYLCNIQFHIFTKHFWKINFYYYLLSPALVFFHISCPLRNVWICS